MDSNEVTISGESKIDVEDRSENKKSIMDTIAAVLIGVVAVLSPVFFIPSASFPFQASKIVFLTVLVSLSFVFFAVSRLKEGKIELLTHKIFVSLGLIILATLLSALFSGSIGLSFIGSGFDSDTLVSYLTLSALLFLTVILFRDSKRVFTAMFGFFLVLGIVALFQISRLIFGADFISLGIFTDMVSNVVGKWNDLAIFFGLGVFLSMLSLEFSSLSRMIKTLLYVVFVISLGLLVVINFNTAWYVLLVLSVILLPYLLLVSRHRRDRPAGSEDLTSNVHLKRRLFPILPIILIAVSAFMLVDSYMRETPFFGLSSQSFGQFLSGKLEIFQVETRPSWKATTDLTLASLKDDPVFGAGPNRFVGVWLQNKPDGVNETIFWNTDFNFAVGMLPTILISGGLLGFLAWVLFLVSFLIVGVRTLLSPVTDKFGRSLSVQTFFAALFLWIFFLIYIPGPVNMILMFFFTGLFLASASNEGLIARRTLWFSDRPKIGFITVIVLVVSILVSLSVGFVVFKKWSAVHNIQKALIAFNGTGDLAATEEALLKSEKTSPTEAVYRFLSQLSLIKINQLISSNDNNLTPEQVQTEFKNLLGEAVGFAQAAVDKNPSNYQNWISFGQVYESLIPLKITGAENAYLVASNAYNKALENNPSSPEIYLILSRLETANGDMKKAREYIAKALEQKTDYTEAVFFLSQIEAQEGNLQEAISQVEKATLLSPNDSTIHFQLGFLEYNTRDYKSAVQAFERAVALNQVYANAKYFLGLSYAKLDRTGDAIKQFEEIKQTNQENEELDLIISNIRAGRDPLANSSAGSPETRSTLPVKESDSSEE